MLVTILTSIGDVRPLMMMCCGDKSQLSRIHSGTRQVARLARKQLSWSKVVDADPRQDQSFIFFLVTDFNGWQPFQYRAVS